MAPPMGVWAEKADGDIREISASEAQSLGYTGPITISEYQRLE
jgi:hypothetical protein